MVKLVIVESPAKCSKIQSYLGEGYIVKATMGHIRALVPKIDSVGITKEWEPTYEELANKKDAIAKLRTAAKGAEIILATDDDREGEGIAWHVCFILKLNPATTPRIVFHEITKPAILAAVAAPRLLNMDKVYAQQARAMLDLLVGFTISRVLWNNVAFKLSAGRCQTPALRLVAERDVEVDGHVADAYWRLSGSWSSRGIKGGLLDAQANSDLATREEAFEALSKVRAAQPSKITAMRESVSISSPPKPYITSTLQQDASTLYGLGPKATMAAAQKLYEAGHITYMRTDNPVLSEEASAAIRVYVTTAHGAEYVGPPGQHTMGAAPVVKKTKAKAKKTDAPAAPEAQAAHEAIRPTHPEAPDPDIADTVQQTVYRLIWRRALQSQMSAAQTDVRKISLAIDADPERAWSTEQTKTKFAGWRVLEKSDLAKQVADVAAWTTWAPHLTVGAALAWQTLQADEQFTKPKGRYTEASLIADLEKRGIGRPSTFATLVSTILDRDYVDKTNIEGKTQDSVHLTLKPAVWPPTETRQAHKVGAEKNKLRSTALGRSVVDYLYREYSDLFAYEFTAAMEGDLDHITQGTKPWKSLLQETWDKYKDRYAEHTSATGAAAKIGRERVLADGVKVILSRKGALFVKDAPAGSPKGVKATFAPLPPAATFDTATLAQAERAFVDAAEARIGELLGMLEDDEIRKKKGPYGPYVECKGARVPLKEDDSLEQIQEKLQAKISFSVTETVYERKVGDFTIKRGPYGLYFYKHKLKRAMFVKFPPALDADKTTVSDLSGLYSDGLSKKRKQFKPSAGGAKKGGGGAAADAVADAKN
jgi:DNA topoisomerase-1